MIVKVTPTLYLDPKIIGKVETSISVRWCPINGFFRVQRTVFFDLTGVTEIANLTTELWQGEDKENLQRDLSAEALDDGRHAKAIESLM